MEEILGIYCVKVANKMLYIRACNSVIGDVR